MTNDGFADALEQLNTVVKIDQKVTIDVLEEAARYFVSKLKKVIPVGQGKYHLQDDLEVKVHQDHVAVIFGNNSWYWHLVEHGHKTTNGKKVKGRHFIRNTLDQENKKLSEMMANKIITKMEG